jgi:hypothetical protein
LNALLVVFDQIKLKEKAQTPMALIPLVNLKRYGYRWIDLDECYQIVNGLNSIGGIPEELFAENGPEMLDRCGVIAESLISIKVLFR